MRRLILGAVALITGLLAAGGIAMARRRGDRDEILELDPAPPLGTGESGATTDASVEADFGPVGEPAETTPEPKKPLPRPKRPPARKPPRSPEPPRGPTRPSLPDHPLRRTVAPSPVPGRMTAP